ncbi:MAG: GH116 family glycosyl-hydrolase [Cyclobacteriaceae bacterium]|nr:GH116 family glycosyl-hydrolase [Cyclobacteriaceae bacterium]
MERRDFLKTAGVFAAGFYASRMPVIAGSFMPGESGGYQIPIDKKLDPAWIKSLYQRGTPTQYFKSKSELQFIGMPVGGINTGTLYLGGDGRLWLWDIFNDNREGIDPKSVPWDTDLHQGKTVRSRDGSAYVAPAKDIRPVDQGFAFQIKTNRKTIIKKMQADDWDDIIFEATYPLATVTYVDKQLGIEIIAEVFSPFIALDEKNSGLPTTIYSFSVNNKSDHKVSVMIAGWLENKTGISQLNVNFERVNLAVTSAGRAILFCSLQSKLPNPELTTLPDYGTMSISSTSKNSFVNTSINPISPESLFMNSKAERRVGLNEKLIGCAIASVDVKPKGKASTDFIISWHFPNLSLSAIPDKGRYYNSLFKSAKEVNNYVQTNFKKLSSETRLWKNTFYDSTLPHWFLERTFLNVSCLATTTSHRMENGRHYAWEGVGCCPGTCTHVWQYAQASGRIFPSLEKEIRERVDLGLSLQNDGSMWYRCEADRRPAVDGQAGTILRFYREHQMSVDSDFLKNNWSKIRSATQFLMLLDKNGDGMEDTPVENTLDAMWDGEIAWIVGLCLAAVKAGEVMAEEMNDIEFAKKCRQYVEDGKKNMEEKLFNGEYFIHRPDAEKGRSRLGSYNTCHIDQVYGQSWAHQVGLGRILDREKTLSALKSLWKYNFTPDVGPYIKEHTGGRPYAIAGEGGMILNSNPKNEEKPYGDNVTWQLGYFHECMSGFEHQVAAHMMAEGMVDEALILTRMIHDRYHAAKRNPFNEIECSDHYARAMASYGTFISACGFEYHGPKGYIRFAPKITPENFSAPFVTAEGWGTYSQQENQLNFTAQLSVKHGKLNVKSLSFQPTGSSSIVKVRVKGKSIVARFIKRENQVSIELSDWITLSVLDKLEVEIS